MAKFTALTPILRDGKRYAEGDTLDMTAKEAEQLLALGAVEPAAAGKQPAKPAEGEQGGE